ncbi:MAG: aromatic amino acid transport family protein [Candidatus Liptonbacteria bacterium]
MNLGADKKTLSIAGTMAATTVGAGIFGLPYIFAYSGWFLAGAYLLILALIVAYVHRLYLRTVKESYGRHRLLGLSEECGGRPLRFLGVIVILGGLTLTLVAYLILVGNLIELVLPGYEIWALLIFWLLTTAIIEFKTKQIIFSESLGTLVIMCAVLGIMAFGIMNPSSSLREYPALNWTKILLPFGPVLFALAGWTAVEPVCEYARKQGLSLRESFRGMNQGTLLSALVYVSFVIGILISAPVVAPDTLSGLNNWQLPGMALVTILAFFAIWTSYVPIGLEIKHSAETDLGWSRWWSSILVFALPPTLLFMGLRDFLGVIGLIGGVFLGLEYVLILWVSKKILRLRGREGSGALALMTLFVLAAIYEIWVFVLG